MADQYSSSLLQPYAARSTRRAADDELLQPPLAPPPSNPSGLVDRLYAEKITPEQIKAHDTGLRQRYSGIKDPYSEEIGPGAGIMRGIDSWLDENVVQPAAKAGYPNAGAAAATVPSTIAEFAVPQTAGDFAGTLIPFGKIGKGAAKAESKLVKAESKIGKAPKGSEAEMIERFGRNSPEHKQYRDILNDSPDKLDHDMGLKKQLMERDVGKYGRIRSLSPLQLYLERAKHLGITDQEAIAKLGLPQEMTDSALKELSKTSGNISNVAAKAENKFGRLSKEELAAQRARDNERVAGTIKPPRAAMSEEELIPKVSARDKFNSRVQANVTPDTPPKKSRADIVGETGGHINNQSSDKFSWGDVRKGESKEVLDAHRGKPLKISTSSDLIAHDDYIAKLDPKHHEVEFHLSPDVPLNDFHSMEKYKGKPSFLRQIKAIKKLREAGIRVKVVDAPEKPLDDITSMRHLGFMPERPKK